MEHDDVIGRLRSLSRQQVDSRLARAQLERATAAAAARSDGRRRAVLTAACLVAVALPAAGIAWARAGGGSGPAGDRPVLPAVASTAPALIGDEPPTSTPASTSVPVPTGAVARRNSDITPARADVVTTPSSTPTPTTAVVRPPDDLPAAANEAAPGPPAGVPGPPDGVPAPGQDGELGPGANVPGPPEGVPGPPEGMPEQAANGQGG